MAAPVAITPDQHRQERAIVLAVALDSCMLVAFLTVAITGGSFTLLAEAIRGAPIMVLESFSLAVLRRIHRGDLEDYDYGTGKLEQVANLVIGVSMMLGAVWITLGAISILTGGREVGHPFGLAVAAIFGAINVWMNLLAWDAVRRAAAAASESLIIQTQLHLRTTKLLASAVISVGLTIAALSTDHVVVAWADALGSLFVAGYLAKSSIGVLRAAVPDLLDRSAGTGIKLAVERGIARHSDSFVRLRRIRSRRSGRTAFVEIALDLDPALSLAEVDRRIEALRASIHAEAGPVEVAILARAAAPAA